MTSSAIVIGAGIGGIATAIHLARQGIHVTVLEKNQRAGGRCDQIVHEGHRFDTGPTLLIMPLVYEHEFDALGIPFHDKLNLQRVDPTYHLVFDDGQRLTLSSDMLHMQEQLEAIEPDCFDNFLEYIAEGHDHYKLSMERLVDHDFRTAPDFFNVKNIPLIFSLDALVPHYRHMSDYFKSARLKAVFTFQDIYMGLSPFDAPSTFSMMPYTELIHGVWYPKGGMYSVVETMVEAARKAGVEFIFETSVTRIDVHEGHATGVTLEDGKHLDADIIVANADLPYVYDSLLPDKAEADRIEQKEFSCSVISFFWGVDKAYPQLGPHTLFLADDYEENFHSIFKHFTLPDNPSLYIHAPQRLDPSAAPEGQDTLIGIVPVGHLDETQEQDWVKIRDDARKAVFARLAILGITDLQDHIKFEVNYTPLSWRKRYNLMKGATHGLSHTLTQLGYFRPHNRHPNYDNLYFVGASTHPGTGIPTALISARLVAKRIFDDQSTLESAK